MVLTVNKKHDIIAYGKVDIKQKLEDMLDFISSRCDLSNELFEKRDMSCYGELDVIP